jgi:hypothetical protein
VANRRSVDRDDHSHHRGWIPLDGTVGFGETESRIRKFDLNGGYRYDWGESGGLPGQLVASHALTVDQEGNLYVADVFAGRVQKFRPKPNAFPDQLVGQERRYWDSN